MCYRSRFDFSFRQLHLRLGWVRFRQLSEFCRTARPPDGPLDVGAVDVEPPVVVRRRGHRQLPLLRRRQRRDDVFGNGGKIQHTTKRVGTDCGNAL